MLDTVLKAQAWKATEWLIRRFKSNDDAKIILTGLHVVLEQPGAWTLATALIAALKTKDWHAAGLAWDALAALWPKPAQK
jgi:hypothetical protein